MTSTEGRVSIASPSVIKWLLDSDPSIRWQVMRDLVNEPHETVAEARSRVATEGWGANLLEHQGHDGRWGGDADNEPPYVYTTNTLVLLKDLGLDPKSEEARRAVALVRDHITWWQLDGRPYFAGETEPCINGRILAAGAYFGEASDRLVDRLLEDQLEDGGWNCEAPDSRRSSFHTTICVLEGLLEFEKSKGATVAVTDARVRAHEYLLERRMYRSLSSGEVIDHQWTRFTFPTTWHYDVLRGLDYLRSADVEADERVADAVDLVAKRQHQNGRWPVRSSHRDGIRFEMEGLVGTASRWNTLRALRVLEWYRRRTQAGTAGKGLGTA